MSRTFSGGRLRTLRRTAGLNRPALAQRVGKSAAAIAAYEAERTAPPPETMAALADAFGVPIDSLFCECGVRRATGAGGPPVRAGAA